MPKKALVIGGLGFIGYHISKLLASNDLTVTIAYRSKSPKHNSDHNLIRLDLTSMAVETVEELLKEFSFVIFCGGADDREMPVGDPESFYYNENVLPCLKLVEASLNSKVEKVIILGSYFTYFDRTKPVWKLKEKHPYIKSRHNQQTKTVKLAQNKLQVSTIEIPYVFGATPGKIPLWKPLINYIDKMPFVFYTKGGTNIMSVEQVAKAVLGVVNADKYKPHWIVGSENVSWTKLIQMVASGLGKKRSVILIPNFMAKSLAFLANVYFRLANKQFGLDLYHFIDVQTANTFLDINESMQELAYNRVSMQKSINETVKACGYTAND